MRFIVVLIVLANSALSVCPATGGELLYNGIELPDVWPPRDIDPSTREVPPVPYLDNPPPVIPINVGRQLLVDDFLIQSTTLQRTFHQPVKYEGNPVLRPETDLEMNQGHCPCAVPFSDGCFYDPADKQFKLWYMAGWFDGVALAVSGKGAHWQRPNLDVVPGTNRVLAPDPRNKRRRDGVSVWMDQDAADPNERFKMFHYARQGDLGAQLTGGNGGSLLTSPDGIHWTWRGTTGYTKDNTTFFYNPFRKVWVFSHRSNTRGRTRNYWENSDFLAALDGWDDYNPVFWLGADKLDPPHPDIGCQTELYKVDAVGYESLMLGLLQIYYGPSNSACAAGGFPKLTELKVAFSRDGFHWDRSARDTFIGATLEEGSWERAYITSCGGCCLIVHDKLYFYYGAFQGDESNVWPPSVSNWSGTYSGGSTGLAVLRRDGFASMDADENGGEIITRPVTFDGKYLFVNVDCPDGEFLVEMLDQDGNVLDPFTFDKCEIISTDSTIQAVTWEGMDEEKGLSAWAGTPVRFRFSLTNGKLYAFWVSPDKSGASGGYVAAGGPGFTGPIHQQGDRLDNAPPPWQPQGRCADQRQEVLIPTVIEKTASGTFFHPTCPSG